MLWNFDKDLQKATEQQQFTSEPVFLLLPHDFYDLPPDKMRQFATDAEKRRIGLLICPDNAATLDSDAAQKLARSRILRQ